MRKLSQQFTFDADASKVYEYLMGPEDERPREFELVDNGFSFACRLLISSNPTVLYSIVISVYLQSGGELDYRKDGWLVWDKEVVEITLAQQTKNRCQAKLFIDDDPQRWYRDDNWILPMSVGSDFVIKVWRILLDEWLSARSSKVTKKKVASKIVIQGHQNIVNVDSTLNAVNQTVQANTYISQDAKQEIESLLKQLFESLKEVQSEMGDETEVVEKMAKDLVENGTKEKPNKKLIEISAEGLKKAAKDLEIIIPSVLLISEKLISFILALHR